MIPLILLIDVLSKESLRFQYTMEQGYDSSCGMSVVATAMDLYWGVPSAEAELIMKGLTKSVSSARIEGDQGEAMVLL